MIDLCHSIFNVATIVGREQGDIKLKKNCKMFFTCLNSGKPEEYDALTDACIGIVLNFLFKRYCNAADNINLKEGPNFSEYALIRKNTTLEKQDCLVLPATPYVMH